MLFSTISNPVQSLLLPILYCTLVGADHLSEGVEELRTKSLIVVLDVLDVLELQSCVWEGTTLCLGLKLLFIIYKKFFVFQDLQVSAVFIFSATFYYYYCLPSRQPKFRDHRLIRIPLLKRVRLNSQDLARDGK